MTIIVNSNPNNQRELLMKYSTHLLSMEGEYREKFKNYKGKCKQMSIENQVVSGIAVGSGTAGVVAALTVVGLPISIALATVSVVGGAISGVITTIGRSNQKNAIRYQQKVTILSQSRIKLNSIIASTFTGTLISNSKIQSGMDVYNDALKKVHQLHLSDISTVNLDVEEGLKAYTEGLESLKESVSKLE